MTAAALVGAARAAGLELRLVDGTVKVRGTITPAMREALRAARDDIAAFLKLPPWTDLDSWCSRLGAAGNLYARRVVLRAWVDAAGGWHDAAGVHLPASLPHNLALATLKAHARMLELGVREDQGDPALMAWLRGAA